MHAPTVTTLFPASNELLNRHWTALHWTKCTSTSARSMITIVPTWQERMHLRQRQRYEMTSGSKLCWHTHRLCVSHIDIGTVTLDPLGSAYVGQGLQVTQEGSNFRKLTNDAITTSKEEATVNWFGWGGGRLHVVVRSEPIFNTCFVTAESGLVTQSSAHVNEGHERGRCVLMANLVDRFMSFSEVSQD